MVGFPVANRVSVNIESHVFTITHTRTGMGVDDSGGILGEYEVKNVNRSDTWGIVYHVLPSKFINYF